MVCVVDMLMNKKLNLMMIYLVDMDSMCYCYGVWFSEVMVVLYWLDWYVG